MPRGLTRYEKALDLAVKAEVPREAQVVAQITRWLKTQEGLWFMKTHGGQYGRAGVPDIIGCVGGHFFAIEVKRPGGKPTPLQLTCMAAIKGAWGNVGVATCLEDAQSIVIRAEEA